MSTYSTGIDMVHIPSFADQLHDKASSFAQGTFTDAERRVSQDGAGRLEEHLAARFGAKEAFIKAWSGSRWGMTPKLGDVDMREIEVVTDAYGRPKIVLHGQMAKQVGEFEASVSLSHDKDYAIAIAILS